ncbi:Protein YOP1 [Candida viswanathii]|uniref:Protein YOP1 n=1 Tax=Candida viswanathii TaxID=5486 RepID=A0A367YNV4_9ASCO|nr:Protein YOP1 [Candida viswanathii]
MSYQDQAKRYLSQIDKSTLNLSILNQFEAKTGFPRSYAVIGAAGFYFLLIILNFGGIGQLLSNIAGFVIPGYYSLVALKTTTSKDDTQLLTYWVVFAFINVIEFWSKTILYYLPFYFLLKTIFLIYLSAFGGANIIYSTVIRPLSDKYITVNNGSPISSKIQDTAEGVSTAIHN